MVVIVSHPKVQVHRTAATHGIYASGSRAGDKSGEFHRPEGGRAGGFKAQAQAHTGTAENNTPARCESGLPQRPTGEYFSSPMRSRIPSGQPTIFSLFSASKGKGNNGSSEEQVGQNIEHRS